MRSGAREAGGGVGGGGDGDADAGETENPRIVVLAHEIVRALARGIADIAEHNEIAERGPGEACQVGGFAGPQSVDKSACGVADGRLLHAGVLHLGRQGRIDGDAAIRRERDKALRKADIARGQCSADFALRHIPIEAAVERLIADPNRIVGCSETVSRGNAFANKRKRDQGKENGADERKGRMPCQPKESPLAHHLVPWPCAGHPRIRAVYVGDLRLFHNKSRSQFPLLEIRLAARYGAVRTSQAG